MTNDRMPIHWSWPISMKHSGGINTTRQLQNLSVESTNKQQWPVPSRPHVNLPEERLHESSWPPRQLASPPQPPAESRSPIVTGLEPSLSVRSVVTRRAPSCSSASSPSSVWSVRSLRTSRPSSDSRALPSWLFRRPARHTWSVSSRTPTCAPSTPSVSPSCQRTSSWPAVSVASVLKYIVFI